VHIIKLFCSDFLRSQVAQNFKFSRALPVPGTHRGILQLSPRPISWLGGARYRPPKNHTPPSALELSASSRFPVTYTPHINLWINPWDSEKRQTNFKCLYSATRSGTVQYNDAGLSCCSIRVVTSQTKPLLSLLTTDRKVNHNPIRTRMISPVRNRVVLAS